MKNIFTYLLIFGLFNFSLSAQNCEVGILFVEAHDCDSTEQYLLDVGFGYVNTSDSFNLYANGMHMGIFAYLDGTVTIGPFPGDGVTDVVIIMVDSEDTTCAADINFEALDCNPVEDCHIREIFAETFDCDSTGHYNIHLVVRADNASDSFLLYINGVDYGLHAYDDVPLTIGSFPGDGVTDLNILAIDSQDSICQAVFNVEALNCEHENECHIREIFAGADCDSTGYYQIHLIVRADNASDSFLLFINGDDYGLHAYDDVPLTIGSFPGDGMTDLSIIVYDSEDSLCVADFQFEALDCGHQNECHIREIFAEAFHCDSLGNYDIHIVVRADNASDSFFLYINGVDFGLYAYVDVPIRVGSFPGDGMTDLSILVVDSEDTICGADFRREARICDPHGDCELSHLIIESSACDEEGRFNVLFTLSLGGDHDQQETYNVRINEETYGDFYFDELPQRIENVLSRNLSHQYIRICSNQHPDCCIEREFVIPCCREEMSCNMENARYTVWCTEDDEFYILLDFDKSGLSSDSFTINGNGREYGHFAYKDRPIILGPFERRNDYEFEFRDLRYHDCDLVLSFDEIECDNPSNLVYLDALNVKIWSSGQYLILDGIEDPSMKMRLNSIDGKQLSSNNMAQGRNQVWVGNIPPGVYLVTIDTNSRSYSVKVFIGN